MFLKWFQDESYHNWFQDASNQRLIVLRGSPESCDCILRSLEPADLGGGELRTSSLPSSGIRAPADPTLYYFHICIFFGDRP